MLRFLYLWLLRLHPPGFRERFSGEMLCIFDQTVASQAGMQRWTGFRLLGDGVVSLLRQWARIAGPREEATAFANDAATAVGSPVFCSLPDFKPRPGAMIYGAALSLAAFCVVFSAMRYSWTHRAAIILPYDNQTEARPQNRFDTKETTRPSKPEPVMSAPGAESEIKPATNPAGTGPTQPPKSAAPMGRVGRPVIVTAPDNSSAAAGLLTNPAVSAYRNEVVREPASAAWLEAYCGTYVADTTAQEITVSAIGGQLSIEIEGQGKISTVAASRTKFLLVGKTNDWIEFAQDQDGAVRELDLYRNGQRQAAHRR